MKSNHNRENARKLKPNPHHSNNAQSHSPPHKKLIKKIELLHKDPKNKYDISLKEDLLAREPPEEEEEAVDFRVEIERRFSRATHNKTYKFPKMADAKTDNREDSQISSLSSSFESLKHVTVYDLSTQNHKNKKSSYYKSSYRRAVTEESRPHKSANYRNQDAGTDYSSEHSGYESEERSGVPIELRVRDKTSATYKKLLGLLDVQLAVAHGKPVPENAVAQAQIKKMQQVDQDQKSKTAYNQPFLQENINREYNGHLHTLEDQDVEVHKLEQRNNKKKERNIKSQGRNDRTQYNYSEFLRPGKLTSSSGISGGVKKNLSQEKVGARIETVPSMGSTTIEKAFAQVNSVSTKGENKITGDLKHESFTKLYSSNILKSGTPQYMKNHQQASNLKENIFRTYTQENYSGTSSKTTIEALYQKAKNEVLSHKLKVTTGTSNLVSYKAKNSNSSLSTTKREETPKDVHARKVNFNNFYGSPDVALEKSGRVLGHSSQNNLSKKESARAFPLGSTYKKPNETTAAAPVYVSYDFSSQPKIAKKPSFKLDFNKRTNQSRDTLSSARNRNKRTSDKFSDVLNTDTTLRNSYDMHQYSYILNNSSQKNTSKKNIGFAPSSNTAAKNLSFTKAFFSYK